VKDVTSLRRLHEQIVRSERLAAAGLLAAGVAHEGGEPAPCISSLAQVSRPAPPILRSAKVSKTSKSTSTGSDGSCSDLTQLNPAYTGDATRDFGADLVDTAVSLFATTPWSGV